MQDVKPFFLVLQFSRRGREELSSTSRPEKYSLAKSALALLLIAGCLWAAQWQYNRGVDRHSRNSKIESNTAKSPVALSSVSDNPSVHEWQPVSVQGKFDRSTQILLRNRYSEGVYGFELLTLFTDVDGRRFWVDCGWVKAAASATEKPKLPDLPSGSVSITGRLRLDTSLPRGNFFAIPSNPNEGLISKANAQSGFNTENFYIDLISGSSTLLTPKVPAELPELSDGPHMAYALQWIFFAGLIGYGRLLIRRDVLTRKEL
jgi:cytochrome oxidase assembly protein ShyY1